MMIAGKIKDFLDRKGLDIIDVARIILSTGLLFGFVSIMLYGMIGSLIL